MEESGVPDPKRRRFSYTIQSITSITITQLPLSAIADYLPTTSRVLLSMALSPADSFTTDGMSEASKAIILSNQSGWEKLDFSDHPDLTDNDLHQLLVLIDAKNTLKILRLNNCHNIIGHGLEPLSGSTVLERVHLFDGDTKKRRLELDIIIPILESILDSTENPRMDLVKNITSELEIYENHRSPTLIDFLLKLNQLLLNGHCDLCVEGNEPVERCELACLSCFKRHCGDCWRNYSDRILKCDKCELMWCRECDEFSECIECESIYCSNCAQDEDVDAAFNCGEPDGAMHDASACAMKCFECRSDIGDVTSCGECRAWYYSKFIDKCETENDQLKEENDRLRKEVEELKLKLSWNYE